MRQSHRSWAWAFCLSFLVFVAPSWAAPVSPEQVLKAAGTFLQGQQQRWKEKPALAPAAGDEVAFARAPAAAEPKPIKGATSQVLAYVVELQPEGFIILSGDTDIRPILGYSFKGRFPFTDSKDNALLHLVQWDVEARFKDLSEGTKRVEALARENTSSWDRYVARDQELLGAAATAEQWGEWITFATWGQRSFYDDFVPDDPTPDPRYPVKCPVGCTATSMAQIAYYWKYPHTLNFGSSDAYSTATRGINIPGDSAALDFAPFSTLNTELATINYDLAQDEIGYLCFGTGIKLRMNYTNEGSGAWRPSAYLNGLGYGSASSAGSWSENRDAVIGNMKNGWPVQIAITGIRVSDAKSVGHSVIVDGYKSTGEFHINMGWSGSSDAWYSLPVIDASGNGYYFDVIADVIYDICPYQGWNQWRADAQNSGRAKYAISDSTPVEKWSVTVPADMDRYQFRDLVVGTGGKIYASLSPMDVGGTKHPYLCVIHPHGYIEKRIPITSSVMSISYLAQNSRGEVFFGVTDDWSTKMVFYRVDPRTDEVVSIFEHSSPDAGWPDWPMKTDADDFLYAVVTRNQPANYDTLYSLTRTGTVRWSWAFPTNIRTPRSIPAVDEAKSRVYLNYYNQTTQKSYLASFNRLAGGSPSTYEFPGTHTLGEYAGPPAIGADGTIYVGCYTKLYALSPAGLSKAWELDFYPAYTFQPDQVSAIGPDGTLYVNYGKLIGGTWHPGFIRAITSNGTAGTVKWERELSPSLGPFDQMGAIQVGANGVVCFTYKRGGVTHTGGLVDRGTYGEIVWDIAFGGGNSFAASRAMIVFSPESIRAFSDGDRGDADGGGMGFANNQPPAAPSDPSPADRSQDLGTALSLSWTGSDPEAQTLKYDVFLGDATMMVPAATGVTTNSYMVDGLAEGTGYIWKVVATDGQAVTEGPTWAFATRPATKSYELGFTYSLVGLPFEDMGITDAETLAQAIPNCAGVWNWDAVAQNWSSHPKGGPNNFAVEDGGVYLASVSSAGTFMCSGAWVLRSYSLAPGYNLISLLKSHQEITTAEDLAQSVPSCTGVWRWDAAGQNWNSHPKGGPNNFAVTVGDTFMVHVTESGTW